MSLLQALFKFSQRPLTEEEKLARILRSAVAQRSELHVVFGQRLTRPVPVRGRFSRMADDNLLLSLQSNAIADVLDNEPCTVYFSVSCQELSGSYAFRTVMKAHDAKDGVTRALVSKPDSYVSRQVRRFERFTPSDEMVHRLAVWSLRPDQLHHSLMTSPGAQSRIMASEPISLSQMLPATLRDIGPADFVLKPNAAEACHLVNVSAGGARLRLGGHLEEPTYNPGDNLLLLLALDKGRQAPPLLLTLAGACCMVDQDGRAMDVKLRFTYWNRQRALEHMNWAPVTLNGVSPLSEWVASGLGIRDLHDL